MMNTHAKLCRRDLLYLRMQALTHFRTAVVDEDCAVLVQIDERAGLIEERSGKRYPELHRRCSQSFFEKFIRCVECINISSSSFVFGRLHQLIVNQLQPVVLDNLSVMSRIASGGTVEVSCPDFRSVLLEVAGNPIHHSFNYRHALRSAKTPERCVGRKVRLVDMTDHGEVGDVVGVVDMQHRPLHDCKGEIRCAAAVTVEVDLHGEDIAFIVKTDFILGEIPMTLAGDLHVVIAEEPDLHRTFRCPTKEG